MEQAAESGNVDAQNNLAVIYLDGLGVEQDKEAAIFWLQEAAKQGNLTAIKTLDLIIEKQPVTTENYNSKRASEIYQRIIAEQQRREKTKNKYIYSDNQQLYQRIIAERQRRENANKGISINSSETSMNVPEEKYVAIPINSVEVPNGKDINYRRITSLQLEIDRLTERIESGESGRDYNRYMQLKSPIFAIHDSERLEAYKVELDKLMLDMKYQ